MLDWVGWGMWGKMGGFVPVCGGENREVKRTAQVFVWKCVEKSRTGSMWQPNSMSSTRIHPPSSEVLLLRIFIWGEEKLLEGGGGTNGLCVVAFPIGWGTFRCIMNEWVDRKVLFCDYMALCLRRITAKRGGSCGWFCWHARLWFSHDMVQPPPTTNPTRSACGQLCFR